MQSKIWLQVIKKCTRGWLKKCFNHLTYGDRKSISIVIQNMLIVGQRPKMGFGCDPRNLDCWMALLQNVGAVH
jgi:hypothetical protein